jgi:hypothetical protein
METVIVVLIVSLAAAWGVWHILRRLRPTPGKPACGSTCDGCACSETSRGLPPADPPSRSLLEK